MKIKRFSLVAATLACYAIIAGASVTSLAAHEVAPNPPTICDVEILVDGLPLTEHPARGTTYIEALEGREYEVRLSNRTGRRIAVALAIDGLNSIDAKTSTPLQASKWVLGPFESTTISGWQTSSGTARRFFFTTEGHSYGEWLGQTDNLGVIEAVVFRERLPKLTQKRESRELRSPSAAEPGRARSSGDASSESSGKPADDDLAATGIGREIDHRVRRVRLELEKRPADRVRLRYEFRRQLVQLGVLPSIGHEEALARRERARGFTDFDFAPDPFRRGR